MVKVEGFDAGHDYQVRGFGEFRALQDALRAMGIEADADDLLGYSGDAFGCDNMHYYSIRSRDVLVAAAAAYGVTATWRFGDEETPYADIRASLAAGTPCIVGGNGFGSSCLYCLVVIGQDPGKGKFLVAGLGDPGGRWVPEPREDGKADGKPWWDGQLPWATGALWVNGVANNWQRNPRLVLRKGSSRPLQVEALRAGLKAGNAGYRHSDFPLQWGSEKWVCKVGRAFLADWPARLDKWSAEIARKPLDANSGDPLDPGYFLPVAVAVRRDAAARFLRRHAMEVPAGARRMLMAAAGHYGKSAREASLLYDELYGVAETRDVAWMDRLAMVRWYIGEGENMRRLVDEYAAKYPADWSARRAVIRKVNKAFRDRVVIRRAIQRIKRIMEHDDIAISQIVSALARM